MNELLDTYLEVVLSAGNDVNVHWAKVKVVNFIDFYKKDPLNMNPLSRVTINENESNKVRQIRNDYCLLIFLPPMTIDSWC